MTLGLRRHQHEGDDHFITVSCHNRKPLLESDEAKQAFLHHLERVRERHDLQVFGYVLMPEHVHLLVSEPATIDLAQTMSVLKVQVSKQLKSDRKRFWLPRYHDVNLVSWDKRAEKLKYMHRNPVKRGICEAPEQYPWSSYRHYLLGEPSPIKLTRNWLEGWQRS